MNADKMRTIPALAAFCTLALANDTGHWKRVEYFKYRPEGMIERTFILEQPEEPDMEQSSTRLRIKAAGQPDFVLVNEYSWWIKLREIPQWLSHQKNEIRSQYVFGFRTLAGESRHTVLFLVGWPFGSSPGSLHVLDLDGDKPPAVLLRKEELEVAGIRDLNGDGIPEIIGVPCLSQEWGDHFLTYDPLHVYALWQGGPKASLSIPMSRAYNEEHH